MWESKLTFKIDMSSVQSKIAVFIFCSVCFICTQFGITDEIPGAVTMAVLGTGSLYVLYSLRQKCKSKQLFWILFAGYLLRILCLFVDLYGKELALIPHSGGDTVKFYEVSMRYYNNDYSWVVTNYPYVIRWIYALFGANRVLAQYVNVFFWFMTVSVIVRTCDQFGVDERWRPVPYMVMAFWPNWVFLSSILLRESIMIFFDTLSFYYFICWMRSGRTGKLVASFFAVLPAVLLHMASVAMWGAYVIVLAMWDVKKQKVIFRFVSLLKMFLLFFLMLSVCYGVPLLRRVIEWKVSNFSWQAITHGRFVDGGSDYLRDMDCQYWYQFVPFTVLRMFYFIFSPFPPHLRGVRDGAAFLMDSVPTFLLTGRSLWNMRRNKSWGYAAVGILCCFMLVGIYAWGTSNAGTAMRHRTMLVGIWVMSYCLSGGICSPEGSSCMSVEKTVGKEKKGLGTEVQIKVH